MAIITTNNLPAAALPVLGTDLMTITRDGINLGKVPVTDAMNGLTPVLNTASPNVTVPVEALVASNTNNTTYANVDVAVVPKGTGSFALQIADGAVAGGNKRGTNAVDLQLVRTTAAQVASGTRSVLLGGQNNTASGQDSVAIAGQANNASGARGICIGANNTASGDTSVAIGNGCTASNSSTVALGDSNLASGQFSAAITRFGTTNGIQGQVAIGHNSDTLGRYQYSLTGLRQSTTGTTPTRATTDAAAAATQNQLTLRNNSVFKVKGTVVAYDTVTLDTKEWEISALIKRGANAAATSLVGTPTVTSAFADTAAAAWAVSVSADTTNGAFAVTVTGAGANPIRWQVELQANETGV